MLQKANQKATKTSSELNENRTEICNTYPVRVSEKTRSAISDLVSRINTGGGYKKIKPDAVIYHSLVKLNDDDIKTLRATTVTYAEMFDREFLRYKRTNKHTTRDDFLGLILTGKVSINQNIV